MGVLTKEQLDEVWHDLGMKYNVRRFHDYLLGRGLLPYIDVNKLSKHVYRLLYEFFVLGMKERPDGRQWFPTETRWRGGEEAERNRAGKAASETGGARPGEDAGLRGDGSSGEGETDAG